MKKRKLLFTMLALGLGAFLGGSGAMAQSSNGWSALTSQAETSTGSWEAITSGSTTGRTLGAANSTSYYYVKDDCTFSNGAGGSGLTILGTVYLYLPAGKSITCTGGNANGTTGAGAGIELASGNTLYIIGGGDGSTVTATGGDAANGGNGGNGGDASGSSGSWTRTGAGGTGGDGGGGGGAGSATRGGAGGTGGAGGASNYYDNGAQDDEKSGTNGSAGNAGSTAGAMGTLYVANGITVNATGGAAGTSGGSGGASGTGYAYDGFSYNVSVGCGGGGGGGGFGGAAANKGTGGPGGGGGGGGAGGAQDFRTNSQGGIYKVTAYGGSGGQNANGSSWATDGSEGLTTYGNCSVENGSFSSSDWVAASGAVTMGSGGSYGAKGTDSSAGTQNATDDDHNLWYTITCHHTMPNVHDTEIKYSPSTGATVILPTTYNGTYQWALGKYGKDCGATRGSTETASEFTTATKEFYGGGSTSTANNTIYLPDVYGDLEFYEVRTICILENNTSNAQEINEFFVAETNPNADAPKWPITVRLKDRTLYKDGYWNTICLPFDITPEQYSASPLSGATIKKLSSTYTGYWPDGGTIGSRTYDHAVVFLHFEDAQPGVYGLERGKPYLVSWDYGSNLVDNTTDVADAEEDHEEDASVVIPELRHQLDFNYVTVKEQATGAGSWEGNYNNEGTVKFTGTFTPIEVGGKRNLILGAENKLYYSPTALSVAACRGFFIIPNNAANAAPEFVMGFDDGETTSIRTIDVTPESRNDGAIYNLSGQRLDALQKGVNIVNGKKVVVK